MLMPNCGLEVDRHCGKCLECLCASRRKVYIPRETAVCPKCKQIKHLNDRDVAWRDSYRPARLAGNCFKCIVYRGNYRGPNYVCSKGFIHLGENPKKDCMVSHTFEVTPRNNRRPCKKANCPANAGRYAARGRSRSPDSDRHGRHRSRSRMDDIDESIEPSDSDTQGSNSDRDSSGSDSDGSDATSGSSDGSTHRSTSHRTTTTGYGTTTRQSTTTHGTASLLHSVAPAKRRTAGKKNAVAVNARKKNEGPLKPTKNGTTTGVAVKRGAAETNKKGSKKKGKKV